MLTHVPAPVLLVYGVNILLFLVDERGNLRQILLQYGGVQLWQALHSHSCMHV